MDERPSVWALLRRLAPYLRPHAPLFAVALLAAPVSSALTVAQPWLIKRAIDDHILTGDLPGLLTTAWLYLATVAAAFVAEASYTLALSYGTMRALVALRRDIFAHTLRLGRRYLDRQPTGKLLTRVSSDVEALGETLTAGAITIVLDAVLVVAILGAMFAAEPFLSALLLLVAPPLALVIDILRRRLRALFTTIRTALSALNAYTSERIQGLDVVQLYRDEARTLEGFERRLYRYRDATIRSNLWDALLFAIVDGLAAICMALLLAYGAGMFGEVTVSVGLLAAFIDSIGRLFEPVRMFSQKLAILQRAAAALEKIFGLLDTDAAIRFGDRVLDGPLRELRVRDLRFSYDGETDVLHGIDFRLEAGQTIALVGRTGSGKTTVGRLLTRAYDGFQGSITLNGVPIDTLTEASLRAMVGVVQQDVQLFEGSVRFNLTLGKPIDDATLEEALRACHAWELVERLGGLDGNIEREGRNISAGEGQLLAFARTLAAGTPLVILDEATANVDSLTEARIERATEALLARRTVLVIAHRLSTVTRADTILVMDAGRIVERGPHRELIERDGPYRQLFQSQFMEIRG